MIYYLVTAQASNTINAYVNHWGRVPESRIRYVLYDDLVRCGRLRPGSYVFSDLERLSAPELTLARQTWEALSGPGVRARTLNNPSTVLRRFDLLQRLFDKGINHFRAFRPGDSLQSLRFPVFIREENEHNGNLTPLLYSPRELTHQLLVLKLKGYRPRDLLIVEFCDTSDTSGIFRKYSAFIIGEEILPRHLIFSRHWNVKKPDLSEAGLSREQQDYLEENPHRTWLREIFKLSGIEYGRIDYSLAGNEPQVWEINTNPTVRKMTPRLTAAFEAIDRAADPGDWTPFTVDPSLARAITVQEGQRRRARIYRRAAGSLSSSPWIRPLVPLAKSLVRSSSRWTSM